MKVNESRVYVVPLRRLSERSAQWRRTKKAVRVLKEFILKHTKADAVKLSRWVNEAFWVDGGQHTIGKIKVKVALKEEEIGSEKNKQKIKVAHVELDVLPAKAKRVEKKTEKKKTLREKIKAKFAKKDESVEEEVKEEKEPAKMTKEQELKMNVKQ